MPNSDPLLPLRLSIETVLIEQQQQLEKALRKALYAWLPEARAAVGQDERITLLAAGPTPDAIAGTATVWTQAVEEGVRPIVGVVFETAVAGGLIQSEVPLEVVPYEAMRDVYWSEVRSRIVGLPNAVWRQMTTAMNRMIDEGTSIDAIGRELDRIMTAANLRGEVTGIARTEATAAYNAGTFGAWQYSADLLGEQLDKVWVATRDLRTRPDHRAADEQRVPLAAPFIVGGVPMMYPGWPGGPPGQVINCRCAMISLTQDEPIPDVGRKPWPSTTAAGLVSTFHLPGKHDQRSHGRRGLPKLDLDEAGFPRGVDISEFTGGGWDEDEDARRVMAQAASRAGFTAVRYDPTVGGGIGAVNDTDPATLLVAERHRWDADWYERASMAPGGFADGQTFWMPQSHGSTPDGYMIDHEGGHRVGMQNGQHKAGYPRMLATVVETIAELGIEVGSVETEYGDHMRVVDVDGPTRPLVIRDIDTYFMRFEVSRALAKAGLSAKTYQGPAEMYAELYAAWVNGSEALIVQRVAEVEGWADEV